MENEVICLDTSILIDFYRKKDKRNSFFFHLTKTYQIFCVSVITEYEVMIGNNEMQDIFWLSFFDNVIILPFTREINRNAVNIHKQLKSINKIISIPDILIAATAITNNLNLATLNTNHFGRVEGLVVIGKDAEAL